jgi:hypothetical protein
MVSDVHEGLKAAVLRPVASAPLSGSRWAATDRHKNHQDRWRSVTDCGSAMSAGSGAHLRLLTLLT